MRLIYIIATALIITSFAAPASPSANFGPATGSAMVTERARSGLSHLGYALTPQLSAATGEMARGLDALTDDRASASLIQDHASLVRSTAEHVRRWLEVVTWQNQIRASSDGVDARIADLLASLFVEGVRRSLDPARTARVVQGELIGQLIEQDRQALIERQATYADLIGKPFVALTFAEARALEALADRDQSREVRASTRASAILRLLVRRLATAPLVPYRPSPTPEAAAVGLPAFRRGLMKIGFTWTDDLDEMSESVGYARHLANLAATVTPADPQRLEHAIFALSRQVREACLLLGLRVGREAEPGAQFAERVALVFTALFRQAVEGSTQPDLAYRALGADLMLNLAFDQSVAMDRVRNAALAAAVGGDEEDSTRTDAYRAWTEPLHLRHADLVTYGHAAEFLSAIGRQLRPSCVDLLGTTPKPSVSAR